MANIFENTTKAPEVPEILNQYAIDLANSYGLNISVFGGNAIVAGVLTVVEEAALVLTDNVVNYIVLNLTSGVLSIDTPTVTIPHVALYKLEVTGGQVVSCIDYRVLYYPAAVALNATALASIMHAATEKGSFANNDEFIQTDSAAGYALVKNKYLTLVNALVALCSAGWNAATATIANRVDSGIVTIASATTPDIFAAAANTISYTGTATCTGFVAAPKAGMSRTLVCATTPSFTCSGSLYIIGVNSGRTVKLLAGTIINVYAVTTTSFKITLENSSVLTKHRMVGGINGGGNGFATDTYLTGSDFFIPLYSFYFGLIYKCTVLVTKTAAGVAAPVFKVRFGTSNSTADTAIGTFTMPAQTAAVDTGLFTIEVGILFYPPFSNIANGYCTVSHANTTTGLANVATSVVNIAGTAPFTDPVADSYISLSVNGGTNANWTIDTMYTSIEGGNFII